MANNTLMNSRSPVTNKSNGTVITGPDVCKTPTPGGPVPIPYPNIAKSADLAKGSKRVKINGASVCLNSSEFSTSVGDDAGVLKGVISNKHKGKAFPISASPDIKIEGKSVVRNSDLFLGNGRNTPPAPIMQSQVAPAVMAPIKDEKCDYCKKKKHDLASKAGNHIGNGQLLRKNIIPNVKNHAWYAGSGSLQAHHLICSEAMDDDDWPDWCADFGYDINCKENGVMLPHMLELACLLHAPLHRGGHAAGVADGITYPDKIKLDIKEIGEKIKAGKYCDNPKALVDELNKYSKKVLSQIDKFRWTITSDGRDYRVGGNGCAGAKGICAKPKQACPHDRRHTLYCNGSPVALSQKVTPLQIGK